MEAKTGHNLVLLIAVWRKSTIYCLVSINDYYMAIMTITPSNTPMFCSETWWCLSMGFHIMYTRPGDSAANPRRFNICLAFNFQPPLMRIRFLNSSIFIIQHRILICVSNFMKLVDTNWHAIPGDMILYSSESSKSSNSIALTSLLQWLESHTEVSYSTSNTPLHSIFSPISVIQILQILSWSDGSVWGKVSKFPVQKGIQYWGEL